MKPFIPELIKIRGEKGDKAADEYRAQLEARFRNEFILAHPELKNRPGAEQYLKSPVAKSKVETKALTASNGAGNIQLLNLGGGGATAPVAAVESSSGSVVPNFSSSDPNNMTTLTVRSIYGLVN